MGKPYEKIKDLDKYAALTSDNSALKIDYKPLNFDALLNAGAFRVTHQGLPDGSFNPDPRAGFSLVSAYNDAAGKQTQKWQDNAAMLPIVKNIFTQEPANIGAHKYLQIVESARDLGLKDSDIFLPSANTPVAMPSNYRLGGRVRMI